MAKKGTNPLFHHGLKNFCRALWELRLLLSSFMQQVMKFATETLPAKTPEQLKKEVVKAANKFLAKKEKLIGT